MNRFEYVMVLVSIIVGLGITHVLFGVGAFIDRRSDGSRIRLGAAHSMWVGYVFVWTIQFWWFEYRFSELAPEWSWGLYLFLVSYAIALFLLAVILVPRSLDGVTDLDEHFMRRRHWFYWTLLGATGIDVMDSALKGGSAYVVDELGPLTWLLWLFSVVACLVGLRSDKLRHHQMWAGIVFAWQFVQSFGDLPTLGF